MVVCVISLLNLEILGSIFSIIFMYISYLVVYREANFLHKGILYLKKKNELKN